MESKSGREIQADNVLKKSLAERQLLFETMTLLDEEEVKQKYEFQEKLGE